MVGTVKTLARENGWICKLFGLHFKLEWSIYFHILHPSPEYLMFTVHVVDVRDFISVSLLNSLVCLESSATNDPMNFISLVCLLWQTNKKLMCIYDCIYA
jgi:hypothetical protein